MQRDIKIPPSFIEYGRFEWADVKYGFDRGFLDGYDVIRIAEQWLPKMTDAKDAEVALAGLFRAEVYRVPGLLAQLVQDGDGPMHRQKWLYLILLWLYEQRNAYEDIFAVVDEIYADFNYPEEMSGFVRYMPATDGYRPEDHSREENERRLFRLWRQFLTANAPDGPGRHLAEE